MLKVREAVIATQDQQQLPQLPTLFPPSPLLVHVSVKSIQCLSIVLLCLCMGLCFIYTFILMYFTFVSPVLHFPSMFTVFFVL